MTPAPERDAMAERVREHLAPLVPTREVSMFGGRAFMVGEKMVACALKDGGLLVRVDADDHEALITRPGAAGAVMGPGRSMGPGWIEVTAASLDDAAMSFWIGTALDYNRVLTGGHP